MAKGQWYTKYAGPTLKKVMKDMATYGPDDRHSLTQELDISRMMCQRNLQIFEATCLDPDSKASNELKQNAMAGMRRALTYVRDMAVAASKVRATSQQVVDVEVIEYCAAQTNEAVMHTLKWLRSKVDFSEYEEEFQERLNERLSNMRMPERKKAEKKDMAAEFADKVRDALKEMDETT